jgi:hypothetical protein
MTVNIIIYEIGFAAKGNLCGERPRRQRVLAPDHQELSVTEGDAR